MSARASRCAQIGPLSSDAPRAYSRWCGEARVGHRVVGDDRRALLGIGDAAQDRLERRRLAPVLGRRGLDVVVTVDQHGARRPGHRRSRRTRPGYRRSRGRAPRRRAPASAATSHSAPRRTRSGSLAHGVHPEAGDEALEDRPAAGPEGAIEGRPVHARHAPPFTIGGTMAGRRDLAAAPADELGDETDVLGRRAAAGADDSRARVEESRVLAPPSPPGRART